MKKTVSPCPKCQALNRVDLERAAEDQPVCARCDAPLLLHDAVSEVDAAALNKLVTASPQPVVVDFWAPWCGPCLAFAPIFLEASLELAGEVVFAKLDTEAHSEPSNKYGIRAIPTMMVFHKGQELARKSGAMNKTALLEWLRSVTPQS